MSETTVFNVLKVVKVPPMEGIPDGDYGGTWGGYVVTFKCHGETYTARTSNGIRTPAAPCRVMVDSGRITVETV